MNLLKDKIAVVTGANRGIGRAIVEAFVDQGARVVACVRQPDSAGLDWIAALNQPSPDRVLVLPLDLADEISVKALPQAILRAVPGVDILVNNAGVASGGLFQMATAAELRRVFEINYFAQIALTQSLSRLMARRKAGAIINITSSAADIADPGTLVYGSSKAAFARASESMATELGSLGIRVNSISPGLTRTDMYEQMDPQARERLVARAALKRPAEPADIANVAVFLASDLSAFVTGQCIRVDGGMV